MDHIRAIVLMHTRTDASNMESVFCFFKIIICTLYTLQSVKWPGHMKVITLYNVHMHGCFRYGNCFDGRLIYSTYKNIHLQTKLYELSLDRTRCYAGITVYTTDAT